MPRKAEALDGLFSFFIVFLQGFIKPKRLVVAAALALLKQLMLVHVDLKELCSLWLRLRVLSHAVPTEAYRISDG